MAVANLALIKRYSQLPKIESLYKGVVGTNRMVMGNILIQDRRQHHQLIAIYSISISHSPFPPALRATLYHITFRFAYFLFLLNHKNPLPGPTITTQSQKAGIESTVCQAQISPERSLHPGLSCSVHVVAGSFPCHTDVQGTVWSACHDVCFAMHGYPSWIPALAGISMWRQ